MPPQNQERLNHDVPKHRCPVCNHICFPARRAALREGGPLPNGRPPEARERLLDVLRTEATWNQPLPLDALAERLYLTPISVRTAIYRARLRGYPIVSVFGQGFFLDEE